MPKYLVQYHRVSTSEGIDRETYVPYTGSDIESKISQRCKKCNVLLYLTKNFKKDKKSVISAMICLTMNKNLALYIFYGLKTKNLGYSETFILNMQKKLM